MTSDLLADPRAHLLLIPLVALTVIFLTSAFDRRGESTTASQSEAGAAQTPATDESPNRATEVTRCELVRQSPPNRAPEGMPSRGRARQPVLVSSRGEVRGLWRREGLSRSRRIRAEGDADQRTRPHGPVRNW